MKNNRMKRVIAILLCMVLLFGSGGSTLGTRAEAASDEKVQATAEITEEETNEVADPIEDQDTDAPEEPAVSDENTEDVSTTPSEDQSTDDSDDVIEDNGSENNDSENNGDDVSEDDSSNASEDVSGDDTDASGDDVDGDSGNTDEDVSKDDPNSSDDSTSTSGDDASDSDKDQTTPEDIVPPTLDTDITNDNNTTNDLENPEDAVNTDTPETPDEPTQEDTVENPDTELTEDDAEEEQETILSEEEQAQVDAVIALIEALPTMEEIAARFEELEEAEDEEGYDAYYLELYEQVGEAKNAYDALTEAQKLVVTNAEVLEQFAWMWADMMEESIWGKLEGDDAYVNKITIEKVVDGVTPFDHVHTDGCYDTDGNTTCGKEGYKGPLKEGDDDSSSNKIVRTFDAVTYHFNVNMESYDDSKSYREARIKMEFVLPLTPEEAVFDKSSMTWMEGVTESTETRTIVIDGKEETRSCQVLTCYAHLLPSANGVSVVPGNYGQSVTVNVKAMKNGETFAPIFSAAMEHGKWDGECTTEGHQKEEKKSVTADKVTVTAAPKYNIQLVGDSSYKTTFDFGTGNENAQNKDTGLMVGRAVKLGITLQLYNDNKSKGLKGIELPDSTRPITFDLKLNSNYHINQPKAGYTQGQDVNVSTEYLPLLWSYDVLHGNNAYGACNLDDREILETQRCVGMAPYASGENENTCYNSGAWKVIQEGDTLHVEISGYQINVDKMPLRNADWGDVRYGADIGIGCFSSGQIWLVQPYNKTVNGNNQGPNFDIVNKYGEGSFTTTAEVENMEVHRLNGSVCNVQIVSNDDRYAKTTELVLPGSLQNRVGYADLVNYVNHGAGIDDNRDGRDYAMVGSELRLLGGFTYNSNMEAGNQLYFGTNLSKFYGKAIEPITENADDLIPYLGSGAVADVTAYYATKKDGTDWKNDDELKGTYEWDLIYYKKMSDIPNNALCVGILYCYKGPGATVEQERDSYPAYTAYHKVKVKDDMKLAGQTFMLASTSRVWTKSMFEKYPGKNPENFLNVSDNGFTITKDAFFENGYTSANIDGSTWYEKETYAEDGSGILGTHNSDWSHWGDTLLVIGYKTGVTKHLLQKSGTTEKTNFNLDTDQRVVDFKLQPRVSYDHKDVSGTGGSSNTTTVKIVDVLPKYLSYVPGSAYIGGTYAQTWPNGGAQGSITDGRQMEPEEGVIEANLKNKELIGCKTLTWTLENVTIGAELPPIYYSANIGTRGNAAEDVPLGSSSLLNRVYITSKYDLRDPSIANGNYAEAGITVTRGSANSFGKYTLENAVDEDGEINYVIYYNNNAQTDATVDMMDTMPANNVAGSSFTGSYKFIGWKLDTSVCDKSKIQIYYTTDAAYKNKTIKDVTEEEFSGWKKAEIGADGTITLPTATPTAWRVTGNLSSGQIVKIDLKLQLIPDPSDPNKKTNHVYVNRLSSGDTTTTTQTPTVRRTLEGLTWMDYNRNGIQDEGESGDRVSGVKVELLRLKEGGDPAKEADYEPVYYPVAEGTNTQPVPVCIQTGQQISLRSLQGSTSTEYDKGRYRFLDLPDGTYAVRFSSGTSEDGDISNWQATGTNLWSNDEIDSDGEPTYTDGKLTKTVILGIEMKDAETMYQESLQVQESKFHDSGFYPNTELQIQKADESGNALKGASFTIADANNSVLSFTEENGTYKAVQIEDTIYGSGEMSGARYYIAYASNTDYVVGFEGENNFLQLQKRTDGENQMFEVIPQENGTFAFKHCTTGKWLDVNSGNWDKDGTGIIRYRENDDPPNVNEKWYLRANKDGSICIQAMRAGTSGSGFMDLNGNNVSQGTQVWIYSKNGSAAQNWKLIPAQNADGTESTLTVDDSGQLKITDLIPGEYTITEMISPTGFALLSNPVKIKVEKNGNIQVLNNPNGMVSGSVNSLTIRNAKLYELPSAGGIGIYWYTISGTLLMIAGLLVLYKKKYAGRC